MQQIDIGILALLALVAFSGWRKGLIVSLISIAGMIAGGIAGHSFAVGYAQPSMSNYVKVALLGAGWIIGAAVGSGLATFAGKKLRMFYKWTPLGLIDNIGGLALSVVMWAFIVWVAARAMVDVPVLRVGKAISHSQVLSTIEPLIPQSLINSVDKLLNAKDLIHKLW